MYEVASFLETGDKLCVCRSLKLELKEMVWENSGSELLVEIPYQYLLTKLNLSHNNSLSNLRNVIIK